MKPHDGRYQTATQVKGLSFGIFNVREADSFHMLEGNNSRFVKAKNLNFSRSLRPWYGITWNVQKLGRSNVFPQQRVFANNLKRRGCENDRLEVGLTHSRGVIEVTFYESITHSKGSAFRCRRLVKHVQSKEFE